LLSGFGLLEVVFDEGEESVEVACFVSVADFFVVVELVCIAEPMAEVGRNAVKVAALEHVGRNASRLNITIHGHSVFENRCGSPGLILSVDL